MTILLNAATGILDSVKNLPSDCTKVSQVWKDDNTQAIITEIARVIFKVLAVAVFVAVPAVYGFEAVSFMQEGEYFELVESISIVSFCILGSSEALNVLDKGILGEGHDLSTKGLLLPFLWTESHNLGFISTKALTDS